MNATVEILAPGPAFAQSTLARYLLAGRDEILRHKWLLSERVNYDVDFDHALIDWVRRHLIAGGGIIFTDSKVLDRARPETLRT